MSTRVPKLRYARVPLCCLNALLCLEATATAAAAILFGIQGDACFTAAIFSRPTAVAASAAVVSVEDHIGAHAVAAEVLWRITAGVATWDGAARRALAKPIYADLPGRAVLVPLTVAGLGLSPGYPRDGGQRTAHEGSAHQPERSTAREGAICKPSCHLV